MKKNVVCTYLLSATVVALVGAAPGTAFAQGMQPMQPMPGTQGQQPMPGTQGQQPMPGNGNGQPMPGTQAPPGNGLAPPPPMDPNATTTPAGAAGTKAQLEAADKADDGRNFELIYVNGDVGASYVNMTSFTSSADSTSFGLKQTQSAGPAFGLSAGVRLVVLAFGLRARLNQLSSFGLWQLNAEAGFKFPVKLFDISIMAHGGYDFIGSLDKAALSSDTSTQAQSDDLTVRGWNAGLDAALDYYLVPMFSIGAGVSGDFLQLNRQPLKKPDGLTQAQRDALDADPLYAKSGQSYGFGFMGGVRLGLHFGF